MTTERLAELSRQRTALLARIAEVRDDHDRRIVVPQMERALEALDGLIAREAAQAPSDG